MSRELRNDTPILDALLGALTIASFCGRKNRRKRPQVTRRITTRQVYDAKEKKVITLTNISESVTYTL